MQSSMLPNFRVCQNSAGQGTAQATLSTAAASASIETHPRAARVLKTIRGGNAVTAGLASDELNNLPTTRR